VPSPIGHVLGGAAVAWGSDAIEGRRSSARFVAVCALLAAAPDLDLLLPGYHRSLTHSLIAVLVVLIIAGGVTGRVTRLRASRFRLRAPRFGGQDGGQDRWRFAIVCACAYASHLLLDWLGADSLPPLGLHLFWPFVRDYFMSGLNVFAETERRMPFSEPTLVKNFWAAARELAIMAPIAAGLWLIRVKTLARLPAEMPSRDHAPQ
jgi:inner membrane protein